MFQFPELIQTLLNKRYPKGLYASYYPQILKLYVCLGIHQMLYNTNKLLYYFTYFYVIITIIWDHKYGTKRFEPLTGANKSFLFNQVHVKIKANQILVPVVPGIISISSNLIRSNYMHQLGWVVHCMYSFMFI